MSDNRTVDEIKQHITDHADEGVLCPACESLVKIYKRPLTGAMTAVLIVMYREHVRQKALTGEPWPWIHLQKMAKKVKGTGTMGGDSAKLRYWSFIRPKSELRDDGSKRNGYYRMTLNGIRFAKGISTTQSHAVVLLGKVLGFKGTDLNRDQALGKDFDFHVLMNG